MLKAGSRVGPFEVLSSLGAGGMGEVYRANDPRLEREIALKVLPADTLADETARARMIREARLAAQLNHPNICTIHEVGEAEGQVYIAMELVEGKPLDTILGQGALPTGSVLHYASQIADALAHAHSRGVVHRDLKSANVVITPEGRAKVLDFGLAKRLAGEELHEVTTQLGASLTEPGAVVGTLAYMAPEQLHGHPADARSDIWALGVVLYEMLGGRRPFVAQTGFALSSAILNEAPPPLPESVPATLRAVVERCLAKAPGERFQTAQEAKTALEIAQSGGVLPAPSRWTFELRRWPLAAAVMATIGTVLVGLDVGGIRRLLPRAGGAHPRVVRMAVLPFVNLSGEEEQEYFSDGLTQEMISQLGRLHPEGLSVIARTSVMRYKQGDTPIDQIGRELNVDYVLEGSAQRETNRIRIAAELIHVGDQTQLWAETYERELVGILALQSEVAEKVAKALALTLLPAEQARLASAPTVDPEAHDAYLQGSFHWKKTTPEGFDTAQRYFDLALAKDPSYAPAYVGLAWVWAARQQMGLVLPSEGGPKAKSAALRAIALDEGCAEAHEALALVRTWTDWDWPGAESEWRRALELDPNAAGPHAWYSNFLAITGWIDQALQHAERAIELDPFNAVYHGFYSIVLQYQRRYADALAAARSGLTLEPGHPVCLNALWFTASHEGQHIEALAAVKAFMNAIYADQTVAEALEQGWAQGGYVEAMNRAAGALAARFSTSFALPSDIAFCYVEARQDEQALEWLERGFEVRDPVMPYLGFPNFDRLRSNPRFQDLVRRMNLPLN